MNYKSSLILVVLSGICIGSGCQEIEDPVFEYNLKSAQVIETNNNFGLELLNGIFLSDDSPNIMISPASVSIALGMAYNGAGSATMDAFKEVLNYEGLTRDEVNEMIKELINVLVTNVKGNQLEIANSLWFDDGFPVKQEFINLNRNSYDAEVQPLDFRNAAAVKTINDWVSDQTHGKIDEIIQSIDPAVMMILINAIYFNCVWEMEFDPKDTEKAPFYREDGSTWGQVDMMRLETTLNTSFTESYSAVELPYKNGKFSMYLFLPGDGMTVNQLAQMMDGNKWNSSLEGFSEMRSFTVYLPRFKFEDERSLSDILKTMGLGIAFTDQADFSGISDVNLLISDVIHKTYIDVNEEGTEAAAVTGVIISTTSLGPPTFLRLDRPFLFAITENSSKSILFIGKVSQPVYQK
jgi:serine protease inhibitor